MKLERLKLVFAAGCSLLALGGGARAAETAGTPEGTTVVEDVKVTARRASASINGLDVDPRTLPQNVRVLDRALIETIGVANLSDLFDLAGGMARQNSFGGAWDAYAIRGFSGDINQGPDLLVNRFVSNRGFNPRRDVATVEAFQVLKGPASALSGKGEPGGSINIVTKAPGRDPVAIVEASYGSFDTWRGVADLNGPLTSTTAARLVAAYQETDGFRDHVGSDRLVLAPSFTWAPTDRLRVLYQLEANKVHFVHDRGVVAIGGNGKALPRTRFLGEPNDGKIRQETLQHQASFFLDLAEGISLEGGVQYRDGLFKGQSTHNGSLVGALLRRQLRIHSYSWEDASGRLELAVKRTLAGVDHQLRIGVDAFDYNQTRVFYRFSPSAAVPYAIDVYNPVYGQAKPTATLNQNILEELNGKSLYVQDLATIGRLTVMLGVRHDWFEQNNTNYRTSRLDQQKPSRTSPRAAVTWMASDTVSLYASWGQSFRYNQGVDAVSRAFAPELGEAYEAGLKVRLLDDALTGTASVFRIEKENTLVNDPANSGFSIAVGEARSEGAEANATWAVSDKLSITAVYAYTDAKVTRDTRPGLTGSSLSNVPKHSGAVYASWASNRTQPGSIGIGGGLSFVGERAGDDVNSGFKLPRYATARVNLGVQVTPSVRAALDVENLFDTAYLESSYSNVWITPGAPRTVTGRLKVVF
ncbi:TonB-dependent siderophore receptor [Caulobacter henricii]|uniref:TonB-dependent siderophore receptor n=1 Tax=Caulobacter henricii TaxID=69395 RepID=UPI000A05953B|nr:TonB-dependent siderophore receptor [Caulobacter henricii]